MRNVLRQAIETGDEPTSSHAREIANMMAIRGWIEFRDT